MAMRRVIDIEALNFRSAPVVDPSNRIAVLNIGQIVELIGDPDADWSKIKVELGGASYEGYVKRAINDIPSLRPRASDAREALVAEAITEWHRFEKGEGQEDDAPFYRYVGQMWQAIGINLDGRDRNVPWSAAAISYMVRNAGKHFPKYGNFKFAPAHATYFHDSIVKEEAKDDSAPFWGIRHYLAHPQIGDIVGVWRTTPRSFDDARAGGSFFSHSDIIVSVQADYVLAIGGNVDQSVSLKSYRKTQSGFLTKNDKVIILMVNKV
jgi:hypothetical protein